MRRWTPFLVLLAGCTTSHGPVGLIAPSADLVGTKLLRPGVTARSCRSSILGFPLRGTQTDLSEAVAQLLALDAEGDVIINADVYSSAFITGIYNHRCLELRGDLARSVPTITLPGPPSHRQHSGHH